ncbi:MULTISPECIES: hypothetical protein [unclassified Aeromicrobium]|uniref:hypothetical protein n=1 Tax=unclassified Aeromicrobium TaxID=2633570 RepID=UPI000ABC2679|nr:MULTISPECIES: hypothetical protein [unclassified Aeromicrobium]
MSVDQGSILSTVVDGRTSSVHASRPSVVGSTVEQRLSRRVLVVASTEATQTAAHVDTAGGGLVVAGTEATRTVRQIKAAYPNLTLLVDPTSHTGHVASEAEPFMLGEEGLFEFTLADHLAGQISAGADIAVTPTGFMEPGDPKALKAALEIVNAVDRDDVLFLLPAHPRWCAEPNVQQLIAVARRSRHPVALALGHKTDPLTTKGVPAGFRRFFAEVGWAMPWRTDLAAFDALAHGAKAAAVGQLPSLRRINLPGEKGFAGRPGEKFPSVLMNDLLRYSRVSHMRENWFASVSPYACDCSVCVGRAVDRFSGSPEHRLEAHLHNLAMINAMRQDIDGLTQAQIAQWWRRRLLDSEEAHIKLGAYTSTTVGMPAVVKEWIDLAG